MKQMDSVEVCKQIRGGAMNELSAEFWGRFRYFAENYSNIKNVKATDKDGIGVAKDNATGLDKVLTLFGGSMQMIIDYLNPLN